MRHPFELKISELEAIHFNTEEELTDEEATLVAGGLTASVGEHGGSTTKALWEAGGCVYPPGRPTKPPVFTTLAIGEEGGCGGPILAK